MSFAGSSSLWMKRQEVLPMIVQTNNPSSISAATVDYFLSKVKLLDDYVIIQTGDREWCCLISSRITGDTTLYKLTRSGSAGSFYEVSEQASSFDYTITRPYYAFTSVGVGTFTLPPIYHTTACFSLVVFLCLCFIKFFFRRLFYEKRR